MLYYLYALHANRVLTSVRNKQGIAEYSANKELAENMASYYSLQLGYPIAIDTNPDLDNTRDGIKIAGSI